MSIPEAFKIFDKDNDGFVTITEFENGIDKITKIR